MNRRELIISATSLAATAAVGIPAFAQAGARRILYPFAAGAGGDILARIIALEIQSRLGTSTIVENRVGADGRIAVRAVKAAAPDGLTLLATPFATMSLFPTVFADLQYNPFTDFTPITQMATFDFGLAVGPKTPAKTLGDFVDWVKKNPNDANYSVTGMGSLPHFLPLLFASAAGIKLQPVAFRGPVPAITAAMAGDVPMVCTPLGDQIPQHQGGTIKILATSGARRSQYLPDVPTLSELGFNVTASAWYGLFAPAALATPLRDTIHQAAVSALKSDAAQAPTKAFFLNVTGSSPEELGRIMKADHDLWAPVIKSAGFAGK